MDYRTLGRSGCAVSTLALGTMTFGAETDEAGAHAQLDAFAEAGGALIDIADVYAGGESEGIVGDWVAETGARGGGGPQGPLPVRPGGHRPRPSPPPPPGPPGA